MRGGTPGTGASATSPRLTAPLPPPPRPARAGSATERGQPLPPSPGEGEPPRRSARTSPQRPPPAGRGEWGGITAPPPPPALRGCDSPHLRLLKKCFAAVVRRARARGGAESRGGARGGAARPPAVGEGGRCRLGEGEAEGSSPASGGSGLPWGWWAQAPLPLPALVARWVSELYTARSNYTASQPATVNSGLKKTQTTQTQSNPLLHPVFPVERPGWGKELRRN